MWQSKVYPRVTSLADCQVDSGKEWRTENARGENRTHLNFIFVCKFSIGFYAVCLAWKRKLSHRNRNRRRSWRRRRNRNMQVNGPLLVASVWAFGHLCTRFALTLAWHELNPHLNRMRMRCPLQLIPLFHRSFLATHSVTKQLKQVCNQCTKFLPEHKTVKQKQKQTDKQTKSRRDGRANWQTLRRTTDTAKDTKTASKLCGSSGCPRRLPCGLVGAFDCKQVQTRLKVCGKGAATRHKTSSQLQNWLTTSQIPFNMEYTDYK